MVGEIKKTLLVTTSSNSIFYLSRAKQLFSGAHFKGGWQGDYMLLAHDIAESELKWFKDKGILIKHCQAVSDKKPLYYHPCVLDKFYLFTPEFKKWDNIVYLDSDILVRASIEKLASVKGFWAVSDHFSCLKTLFINKKNKRTDIKNFVLQPNGITYLEEQYEKWDTACGHLAQVLKKKYDLDRPAFNTGVMAFSSDIIQKNLFSAAAEMLNNYGEISRFADQGILNLLFYNKWMKPPFFYNIHYKFFTDALKLKPHKIKGVLIHLLDNSIPQGPQDPFYEEWMGNLKKAEEIDLNARPPAKQKYNLFASHLYSVCLVCHKPGLFWWFIRATRLYFVYRWAKKAHSIVFNQNQS
jgi:hypothetical protein